MYMLKLLCTSYYLSYTVVGVYSATGKVTFVFDSVVLYIEYICNLTGTILRDDDFPFALYTPTTVEFQISVLTESVGVCLLRSLSERLKIKDDDKKLQK